MTTNAVLWFREVISGQGQPSALQKTPVVLHPLETTSIAKDKLGKFVKSLANEGDRIIDALDELITRAYG